MQHLRDNNGVLEASNNGTDWEIVQVGQGGGIPTEIDSPVTMGTLQLRDNAGVLELSTDSGSTWAPVGGSAGLPAEIDSPVTLGTLQLRDNAGVFELSTDSGSTWTEIGAGGGGGLPAIHRQGNGAIPANQMQGDFYSLDYDATAITLPRINTLTPGSHLYLFAWNGAGTTITPHSADYISLPGSTPSGGSAGQAAILGNSAGFGVVHLVAYVEANIGYWLAFSARGLSLAGDHLQNAIRVGGDVAIGDDDGSFAYSEDGGSSWMYPLDSSHTNGDPLVHNLGQQGLFARPRWGNYILQTGGASILIVEANATFTLGQAIGPGDYLYIISGGVMGTITVSSTYGNVLLGASSGTTLICTTSARGDYVRLVYLNGADSMPTGWIVLDARGSWSVS